MLVEFDCEQCGKSGSREVYGKQIGKKVRFCPRRCCLLKGEGGSSPKNRIRPFEALYNNLVYHAKRRNKLVALTYEEFVAYTEIVECHYCGAPVKWAEFGLAKNGRSYNLDQSP